VIEILGLPLPVPKVVDQSKVCKPGLNLAINCPLLGVPYTALFINVEPEAFVCPVINTLLSPSLLTK